MNNRQSANPSNPSNQANPPKKRGTAPRNNTSGKNTSGNNASGKNTPRKIAQGKNAQGKTAQGKNPSSHALSKRPIHSTQIKTASTAELSTVPAAQRNRVAKRLRTAAKDYQAGYFGEVEQELANLVRSYPNELELVELYGLTQYRLGHWDKAIDALGKVTERTGVIDHLPIIADCHRALGDFDRVQSLWDQLRQSSPDADTMTEGRIVTAGALADSGDLAAAIRLLERGPVKTSVVRERHLRIWYALADLYDRAGEAQRARRGFSRIVGVDSDYLDAADRLNALGEG